MTNWMSNDDGEGSSDQFVEHNEVQYTKIYRDRVDIGAPQIA